MKASVRAFAIAGVLTSVFGSLACRPVTPVDDGSRSSLTELTGLLSGRFRGTTPGNDLALEVSTVGARAGTNFDLIVTASGRYRDSNVRRVGLLRLATQGRDVRAVYVPHFDATVTPLSRTATRFTQEELEAACTLYFHPSGDGFVGELSGGMTCARALPGAVGKWTVEVDPGSLRLRNVESGETLRFAKRT
ncbi:MAG TPA: hypothetical protein VFW15_06800 [Thermoanaerobaculia bacterium]|nr:hypothetical protein [Thermoanaerobaculia bacterium]